MKKIFSFIIVIIFFLVGFFLINSSSHPTPSPIPDARGGIGVRSEDIKYVKIAGQNIKVELALTPAQQEQGLSSRQGLAEGLAENTGMLFVFTNPGKYPFWMKDMNFPIDIIWLDENGNIVYIKKDARPELYPETYGPGPSDSEAKYVLEVISGFSDKNNLKVGDSALFTY
jgi:hypothetical protein